MAEKVLDVLVIGAGHAGLCTGYYLKQAGIHHLILERNSIGDSWASKRWNSFRLNTYNSQNELPGLTGYYSDPDGFSPAPDFVSYLRNYAETFELPVLEQTRVLEISRPPETSLFHVLTHQRGEEHRYLTRAVVVASGTQNRAMVPPFAGDLPPETLQLTAGEYRNTSGLPEGAVLVAGSAQSGVQIARDLLTGGKKVFLATSSVGRVPRRYRGRDVMEWLLRMGFLDHRPEDVPDPVMLRMTQPQVSGVGPRGSTVSLQDLGRNGAKILGKLDHVEEDRVCFQSNAADHVKFADEFSGRIKEMVDQYILKSGTEAPPDEPDPVDLPDENASCASEDTWLSLGENHITSVIWATGFDGDFSYLKLPVFNEDGSVKHLKGVSGIDGLFFIGLPWMRKRKSALIHGVGEDAEFICGKVKEFLEI